MTDHDKKISGVEAPMNPVQQQSAPSEGRRRLMKGALAAPAVMTLMHGRLAAGMSITCLEKAGDDPGVGWTNGGVTLSSNQDNELGYPITNDDGSPGFMKLSDLTEDQKNQFYPSTSCLNSLNPHSQV